MISPEKNRAAVRKWYLANPEKVKARSRKWYLVNQEKIKACSRKWRAANPEKVKVRQRKWQIANPEKVKEQSNRHRARKYLNGGSFTAMEWVALCKEHGYKCLACGEAKPLTADHVIPLVLGGVNLIENIQPLCKSCNSKKGTQIMDYRGSAK